MRFLCIVVVALGVLVSVTVDGQYAERPDLMGVGSAAVDCSGRSIKNHRVRAVHDDDPAREGGTAYVMRTDPFLAYQLGRDINFREFRAEHGVFSDLIGSLNGKNPDGNSAKITANNHTSCLGCHSIPSGNPGGGPNFSKDSGRGRKTPHYFGAGIIEMLGLQIRAEIMSRLDANRDGWIDASEAGASEGRAPVLSAPGGPVVDFGDPRLSNGRTGKPNLNNVLEVWYVDADGVPVTAAHEVDGKRTFGYNFAVMVWGWGQGRGRSGMQATNRAFLWDPLNTHSGMQAYDPTTSVGAAHGISKPSLPGAIQMGFLRPPPDVGTAIDPLGFSMDDPDGDGYLNEITEGDLDLGEWFMLNVPRPAFAGTPVEFEAGLKRMEAFDCTSCHVNNWQIRAKDATYDGDRRFFDLDVAWNEREGQLTGTLIRLDTNRNGLRIPNRRGFLVPGLFTDFRQHDLGPDAEEIDFGGTSNRIWRTPALWGKGSGFPWMHDGASLTLEHAIRRHGGTAAASRAKFLAAPAKERAALLDMLAKLVLYDIESLPADIDGDGEISERFMAAGEDTGIERFNAEWLFRTPLRIQGLVKNGLGRMILSFAGVNIRDAFGDDLELRRDSDGDTWPDVLDRKPYARGYRNGEQ